MNSKKVPDKVLSGITAVIAIGSYMLLGIYISKVAMNLYPDKNIGRDLAIIAALIIVGCILAFVHTIIHEGGHLIGGLITGWEYLSFRVGSLVLVKQAGEWKWKKTMVMGTGGQCLMIPPNCELEKCPCFAYLLGGGLANIITAGIVALIAIPAEGILEIVLIIFAVLGMSIGVTNLFPAKMGGIMNDGYQIFVELPKNEKTLAAQTALLAANAYLTNNETVENMPQNVRDYIMNADYSDLENVATANLLCYKAILVGEAGEYEEVVSIYQRLFDDKDVLQLFKYEAACELIYYEIMGECKAERIEYLLDKSQSDYIKATKIYPSRKRLMYAYYLIYKGDEAAADEEYKAFHKALKTHPIKAEVTMEIKEIDRIKKKCELNMYDTKEVTNE